MKSGLKLNIPTIRTQSQDEAELEVKMAEFKADPKRMEEASEFVDDLLTIAQKEAEVKLLARESLKKQEATEARPETNGIKAGRMVARARNMIVRVFEALCNCTNTAAAGRPSVSKPRRQP